MNIKHKKSVKRKRIKEGRIKCHGSVFSCVAPGAHVWVNRMRAEHVRRKEGREKFMNKAKEAKKDKGFFNKLFGKHYDNIK